MLQHAQPLSAYEEHVSKQDILYIKAALDPKIRNSKTMDFILAKENDFYTDAQRFRVQWVSKRSPETKEFTAPDLETLCQMMVAVGTMEQ